MSCSDWEASGYRGPYVDSICLHVFFVEKSCGLYWVLAVGSDSLTVKVTLNPGHRINYLSNEMYNEIWMVFC